MLNEKEEPDPMILNEAAPLERYGHDLTKLAMLGMFAPLSSYEAVVDQVMQVLQRKNRNLPLILTTDEATRWAIVAEVIRGWRREMFLSLCIHGRSSG